MAFRQFLVSNGHLTSISIMTLRFPSRLRASAVIAFASSLALAPILSGAEKEVEFPDASQAAVVKQRVGLTDVEVTYSR
ncbi:MAG: hypothetical protein M3Q86_11795, partial [Verrucomicrobiota bacterium]|nr:hypothetical protein [Verrucomicrobiota bacterium]